MVAQWRVFARVRLRDLRDLVRCLEFPFRLPPCAVNGSKISSKDELEGTYFLVVIFAHVFRSNLPQCTKPVLGSSSLLISL